MVHRKRNVAHICLVLTLILAAACTSPPQENDIARQAEHGNDGNAQLAKALFAQYKSWQGVPYKLGGTSKNGIDCSAFVQKTFIEQFGLLLPRTTKEQAEFGSYVEATNLSTGDLVFFKTGFKARHVGIYLEQGQFLHASTSNGVMLSSLKNSYWQKAYWQARTVLK